MSKVSAFVEKVKLRVSNEWNFQINRLIKLSRILYPQQHQLTSTTELNRYPELFEECQKASKDLNKSDLSILSFGCSTGEECFSLREYFPEANIIGVDINKRNLSKARVKNSDSNIEFIFSTKDNIKRKGPYHVIFCLSVLCRWEDTKYLNNCEEVYSFSKFRETVAMLSDHLLPGGLLVIYNSNFCFEDTDVFVQDKFEIVPTPSVKDSGFVYKFDKKNNRVLGVHKNCVYRKG